MNSNEDLPRPFMKPWLLGLLAAVLFVAALGIRLYDLTDLPNDFYMVRQYRSLLIARGMFYATSPAAPENLRDIAVSQWKQQGLIEPPIIESLAALSYHLIGEHIWVGRVISSLFWLAGGLAIWLLAKDLSMLEGGILALAYFLFLPFAVTASRTFMPDPLMTALITWSLWALHRWEARRTIKSALLAGILTGMAILVKSVAVFPLLGAAAGLMLSRGSLKRIVSDKQVWLVAGVTILPTVLFYIYGLFIVGTLGSQFSLRFIAALIKDPSFYGRWLFNAAGIVGFSAMLLSLAGILLFRLKAVRFMVLGAWFGYVAFGFAFPYHFITHSYYHLPLIPIVAIGLIPVAQLLIRQVTLQGRWASPLFVGLLIFGVSMKMWEARNSMAVNQYRHEVSYWQELGRQIGTDKKIVELSGDYGCRLAYFGWVSGSQWLSTADVALRVLAGQKLPDFATTFAEQTDGKDLFVVTSLPELDNQTELSAYLANHEKLIAQGDGYLIYDLSQNR